MALKSLGAVTVAAAGTPARATANESDPTARVPAQSFQVQQVTGNTGKVYVGTSAMNKATLAGVFTVLPAIATGTLPSYSATIVNAPAGFNMAEVYIDVDTNGEKALIAITEQ